MANEIILEIVKSKINELFSDARSISGINHNYLKGHLKEIFIDKLFSPLLTKGFKTGSGKIVDFTGNQSSEIDLLIYNSNFLPPFLFNEKLGVFPSESCFYAFEIKSKTSATEIKDTISKFKKFDDFKTLSGGSKDYEPNFREGVLFRKVLVAFDSDLKDKSELERYMELDSNANTNPAIDVIVILGKEYSFFNDKWITAPAQTSKEETLLFFITGLLNSLPSLYERRVHPQFGWYLIETQHTEKFKKK